MNEKESSTAKFMAMTHSLSPSVNKKKEKGSAT
jgi:hypothetical protein